MPLSGASFSHRCDKDAASPGWGSTCVLKLERKVCTRCAETCSLSGSNTQLAGGKPVLPAYHSRLRACRARCAGGAGRPQLLHLPRPAVQPGTCPINLKPYSLQACMRPGRQADHNGGRSGGCFHNCMQPMSSALNSRQAPSQGCIETLYTHGGCKELQSCKRTALQAPDGGLGIPEGCTS